MRTMYDSTTVGDIPASAVMVAPYVDGAYANLPAMAHRFPKARLVRITVTGGTTDADVVDIESRDCTPLSGVAWGRRRVDVGKHWAPYCNLSTLPAVLEQIDLHKLSRATPIWTAHPTGKAHLCDATCFRAAGLRLPFTPNIIATQYAWPGHGSGGHYDVSLVANYWPDIDPAAKPVAPVYVYKRTLRRGMVGADVTALKRRLKYLGYGGIFPGPVFGRGLDTAVRTFQRKHKLAVDGVVGPITAKAIG